MMRAILTYHSVDDSGSPISVAPDEFRAHARFLASGRVRVLPLREIVTAPESADAVALTFDDGYENFAEAAHPIMAEHGLPATVFVVSGHVGGVNAWDTAGPHAMPPLRLMSWQRLAHLATQGVEIGAHTRHHRDLTTLTDQELTDEIAGGAEDIAREIGVRVRSFAYPYGRHNDLAIHRVARVMDLACTTELRALRSGEDVFALPRLDMYYFRTVGRLEKWGTGGFRRRIWFRAQGRRVRGLAGRVGVGR